MYGGDLHHVKEWGTLKRVRPNFSLLRSDHLFYNRFDKFGICVLIIELLINLSQELNWVRFQKLQQLRSPVLPVYVMFVNVARTYYEYLRYCQGSWGNFPISSLISDCLGFFRIFQFLTA